MQPPTRMEWDAKRRDIMKNGLKAKFSDPDLSAYLLATGNAHLMEASHDKIWGTGINIKNDRCLEDKYEGENLMGILLMEVRDELKQSSSSEEDGNQEIDII